MGSNCCKGDAPGRLRSTASIYDRSRAGASLDDRFTTSDDAGGVRLTVSTARTGDSGIYTLQASNAAGSDTTKVRLEVSADEAPTGEDPPTFLRRLQDLTVKVGTRTRFLVEILSSTECKVTWYRNERRLMEAERVSLARDGNFWCADVATVSVDDAGRWTCTAENSGGRASCSAHLNVLVPKAYKRPEFVEELRALLTEQGTVSLECKVVGVPTPVLRWFKDSCEIKAGDVFALTANAEDPTSLGTYTCEAVNCMGRAYSSSKVHVVGQGSREGSARPSTSGVIPEPPPIFTKELEDQAVRICEPITFSCQLVVPPWPRSVVWYNKEGKVEPGERYHVMEDGVGGYLLEVVSAEWQDEGEWKCVATSSGGRVGISTCFVTMDVPKNYRKPRFMENLQAVLTEEGLVSFECKVVGFPTPVLSWFKDGQELKPGDVYQLTGTNSLGSYCCIARNCMGQASSSAELTVEDIQNQLNEEEKLQLFSKNQAPKFIQGLKSVEVKIDEPFRFTIKVAIPPDPSVLWYRDDQPVDESSRCHHGREDRGVFYLDIQNLEFLDQAEWKCVAINDFGHSVTSCFLKLIIPRHYKKPRFLENLQAILSEEGAVNLECKVIGVPQPVLKWYKDGEELRPGDIHRIISGQDGTCCLGTYTCEAQNCMGIAASSASLLGFDDSMKTKKKKTEEQALQRNLSLSTIHEERTSQMYDTPVGDITEDKGEISFSFDGKEVSVSLYETPDLTEEEALQIVEMYADQLSENVTEHNVVELPPLRFVKETSTSGNLLMEAIIIDVSPEYFPSHDEDLRTEADVDEISIAEENGHPSLSLDQDVDIAGEDYLEKTMMLLSDEKGYNFARKKSDSQKSVDDYFSLSKEHSLSDGKKDDDTQIMSESDLQSFASAKSLEKQKSKSPKPAEETQDSSEPTKTVLVKEEIKIPEESVIARKERHRSHSRRSSFESEKCQAKPKKELMKTQEEHIKYLDLSKHIQAEQQEVSTKNENIPTLQSSIIISDDEKQDKIEINSEEVKNTLLSISERISKVMANIEFIEKDIILKSELMSSAATASKSLEIISSLITPLSEIHSITDAAKESAWDRDLASVLLNTLVQPLKKLQQSLTIIEKCIDVESDNKTLVKKTCVAFIESCGEDVQTLVSEIYAVVAKPYLSLDAKVLNEIVTISHETNAVIKFSTETIKARNLLNEANTIKDFPAEGQHLKETQKTLFELKSAINSLMDIVENAEIHKIEEKRKVKTTQIILANMSFAIHDLQTSLEQIECLSVKDSNSSLPNYNLEIVESVMDSVLKLRTSFEILSSENVHDEKRLTEILEDIKINLKQVRSHINRVENNIGTYDILQSENKLNVLQKMAQILIALENNLPRLEIIPEVKISLDMFHKNLTKVLENVIESNEVKKYCILMAICDAVNRMNSLIRDIDSENVLPLASINSTLKIVEDKLIKNVFQPELNCALITNITDTIINIQEVINKAEEVSVLFDSDYVQEMPCTVYDISQSQRVIQRIEQTIAAISTIKVLESVSWIKEKFIPVLENIKPVIVELQKNIAYTTDGAFQDENLSNMSSDSFSKSIASTLYEINQNIIVLSQIIIENTDSIKDNKDILATFAEQLHELHKSLEILQQDVISQYGEEFIFYEVSLKFADAVTNLQSCIVMVQEQVGVEGIDELSTLEDISGIKTSVATVTSDRLVIPTGEITIPEVKVDEFETERPKSAAADALQILNEHLTVLQNPDILETLETLSEISELSSLKSVLTGLAELHTGIEEILHPVLLDKSDDILNLVNTSKLLAIAEPMQELQQNLSVLEIDNFPMFENTLDIPPNEIREVFETISNFKEHLSKCMRAMFSALETAENTVEISNTVGLLREACKQLKNIIESIGLTKTTHPQYLKISKLNKTVSNLLDVTDISKGIKIEKVKYITEDLLNEVFNVQEELINFIPRSPNQFDQEVRLIETIHEVENNIAVLEQYDFIDLSKASDLTSCTSLQAALELESSSLMDMDDIVQNAVNVMQNSIEEMPLADLLIVEDFFKMCKNEFTILRCLASKTCSYKKIIRILQEFYCLQTIVNEFKVTRLGLNLSDEVNACLTSFILHADECLKDVRKSLTKIVESQSDLLFQEPLSKIEIKYRELNEMITKEPEIKEVLLQFIEVLNVVKPCIKSAKIDIIEELKGTPLIKERSKGKQLTDKVEKLTAFIKNQINNSSKESKLKLESVLQCLEKHSDYKDATDVGQVMILSKCLTECVDVIQDDKSKQPSNIEKIESQVTSEQKVEGDLKTILTEMLNPIQTLHNQLKCIQEQVLSGVDEESISVDLTTTKSLVNTMTEMEKEIVDHIDNLPVDSEEFSLLIQVNKEIQSIQDSLKGVDNVKVVQNVKEFVKPLDEVGKTLQNIMTPQKFVTKSKEGFTSENATQLIQHIDQYIELIEIVEEISAVIKIQDLKESVNIAKELRESITFESDLETEKALPIQVTAKQNQLANKLHKSLAALQVQVMDSAQELASDMYYEVIQRITKVTEQLNADMIAVIGVDVVVQAPFSDPQEINDLKKTYSKLSSESSAIISDVADVVKGKNEEVMEKEDEIYIKTVSNDRTKIFMKEDQIDKDKPIICPELIGIEQIQDIEEEVSKTPTIESSEKREEIIENLHFTEATTVRVVPVEAVSEIKQDMQASQIVNEFLRETMKTETRKVVSTEMLVDELALSIECGISQEQAFESSEHQEERTVQVQSAEVVTDLAVPDGTSLEIKIDMTASQKDVKFDKLVEKPESKEVVTAEVFATEQTADIISKGSQEQTNESSAIQEDSTIQVKSTEVVTDLVIITQTTPEIKEGLLASQVSIKPDDMAEEIGKVEAQKVITTQVLAIEQAIDIKSDVGQVQAVESSENREESTAKVKSAEAIPNLLTPIESLAGIKEGLTSSQTLVKPQEVIEKTVLMEVKKVVPDQQAVDIEEEAVQAVESFEKRKENTLIVQSTEVITDLVTPVATISEMEEQLIVSQEVVPPDEAVGKTVIAEAKEKVPAEQVVDIEGEASRELAVKSSEQRDEHTAIVKPMDVITELVVPAETISEIAENPTQTVIKADEVIEKTVTAEAKKVVAAEQAVDIEGKASREQAVESSEKREEHNIAIVKSTEVVTDLVAPVETTLEIIEEPTAIQTVIKADEVIEKPVTAEAKEVVAAEQAVNIEGEASREQAVQSSKKREEHTETVQSTEIVTDSVAPAETILEIIEEPTATQAVIKTDEVIEKTVTSEAKEVVATEQAVYIEGEASTEQAIESSGKPEKHTAIVQSTETVSDLAAPGETTSEITEKPKATQTVIKTEEVTGKTMTVEAKEVVTAEQAVNIEGEDSGEQVVVSSEKREEHNKTIVKSTEVVTDLVAPAEITSEITEEPTATQTVIKADEVIEKTVIAETKEVVAAEQAVDIEGKASREQALEISEKRVEHTATVHSTEIVTDLVEPAETISKIAEDPTQTAIKADEVIEKTVTLETKEVVAAEQAVNIKGEISREQAVESSEKRDEHTATVQSTEIVTNLVAPAETILEIIEEPTATQAIIKTDEVIVKTMTAEEKEVLAAEQVVHIEVETSREQAVESTEKREELTAVVQSTEKVSDLKAPAATTTEITEEPTASQTLIKADEVIEKTVTSEAKEIVAAEQAVDIEGEASREQAVEFSEQREEHAAIVQSSEIVTDLVALAETTLKITEEPTATQAVIKADEVIEKTVTTEAKDIMAAEQTVDIEGEASREQALKSSEQREEHAAIVQSTEIVTDLVAPAETTSEITEEPTATQTVMKAAGVIEKTVTTETKEVVTAEQAVDIEEKASREQAFESSEKREEHIAIVESTEIVTDLVAPAETISEITEEPTTTQTVIEADEVIEKTFTAEAKEVVATEQAVDMERKASREQAVESSEQREEHAAIAQPTEIVTDLVVPAETTSEITDEPTATQTVIKADEVIEKTVTAEAKEVVAAEHTVDIEGEASREQAVESSEKREEHTAAVQSTEIVTDLVAPVETILEIIEELTATQAVIKTDEVIEKTVIAEAKEIVAAEQAVDIEGEASQEQAVESSEKQEEYNIAIVKPTEVVTDLVLPAETISEITEEPRANQIVAKANEVVENTVTVEIKEVVASEQAVNIEGEAPREQAVESSEKREEHNKAIVKSTEVVIDLVAPAETTSEITEKPTATQTVIKADEVIEKTVTTETKEVVAAEQAVDIEGKASREQAIESSEKREEHTATVQSTEIVTDLVAPVETISEIIEEPTATQIVINSDEVIERTVTAEAKEVVAAEQTVDIEEEASEQADSVESKLSQAIKAVDNREISTVNVQSTETVTDVIKPTETIIKMNDQVPSAADVKSDNAVEDMVKIKSKDIVCTEKVSTEQDTYIEGDILLAQAAVSSAKEADIVKAPDAIHNIDGNNSIRETHAVIEETVKSVDASTGILDNEQSINTKGVQNIDICEIQREKTQSTKTVSDILQTEKISDLHEDLQNIDKSYIPLEKIAITEEASPVLFEELAVDKNVAMIPVTAGETVEEPLPRVIIAHGGIIQHIEDFIANDITEIVDVISSLTPTDKLKDTVVVAKELRNIIIASDTQVFESTGLIKETMVQQAKLAEKLQNSLSLLHIKALESWEQIPSIKPGQLQNISEIITHLQDDLENVIVNAPVMIEEGRTHEGEIEKRQEIEEDTMNHLESLLKDVTMFIDSTDKTESESLKDTLDEVQTVIIKLKKDFDGAGDTLNETLDDLECSVRSVQLQIIEDSPQELLKEACATLKLLVNNMSETMNLNSILPMKKESNEKILETCTYEIKGTIKLLENAAKIKVNDLGNIKNVISCLISLKDTMKNLKESFTGNSEELIERGLEVVQSLSLIEDNLFSIERDVDTEDTIKSEIKNSIKTAINSVYGSISNMRNTISTIQKRYMYENYGYPSKILLESIKNITFMANVDEEKKNTWKMLSKSLRNVFNHFEDIKFYINFDKTARLPSDAGFTKIILKGLQSNMYELVSHPLSKHPEVNKTIQGTLKCIEKNLHVLETRSTVEVKTKIPIFKEIATHVNDLSATIRSKLEQESTEILLSKESEILSQKSIELGLETIVGNQNFDAQQDQTIDLDAMKQKNKTSINKDLKTVTEMVHEALSKIDSIVDETEEILKPLHEKYDTNIKMAQETSTSADIQKPSTSRKYEFELENNEMINTIETDNCELEKQDHVNDVIAKDMKSKDNKSSLMDVEDKLVDMTLNISELKEQNGNEEENNKKEIEQVQEKENIKVENNDITKQDNNLKVEKDNEKSKEKTGKLKKKKESQKLISQEKTQLEEVQSNIENKNINEKIEKLDQEYPITEKQNLMGKNLEEKKNNLNEDTISRTKKEETESNILQDVTLKQEQAKKLKKEDCDSKNVAEVRKNHEYVESEKQKEKDKTKTIQLEEEKLERSEDQTNVKQYEEINKKNEIEELKQQTQKQEKHSALVTEEEKTKVELEQEVKESNMNENVLERKTDLQNEKELVTETTSAKQETQRFQEKSLKDEHQTKETKDVKKTKLSKGKRKGEIDYEKLERKSTGQENVVKEEKELEQMEKQDLKSESQNDNGEAKMNIGKVKEKLDTKSSVPKEDIEVQNEKENLEKETNALKTEEDTKKNKSQEEMQAKGKDAQENIEKKEVKKKELPKNNRKPEDHNKKIELEGKKQENVDKSEKDLETLDNNKNVGNKLQTQKLVQKPVVQENEENKLDDKTQALENKVQENNDNRGSKKHKLIKEKVKENSENKKTEAKHTIKVDEENTDLHNTVKEDEKIQNNTRTEIKTSSIENLIKEQETSMKREGDDVISKTQEEMTNVEEQTIILKEKEEPTEKKTLKESLASDKESQENKEKKETRKKNVAKDSTNKIEKAKKQSDALKDEDKKIQSQIQTVQQEKKDLEAKLQEVSKDIQNVNNIVEEKKPQEEARVLQKGKDIRENKDKLIKEKQPKDSMDEKNLEIKKIEKSLNREEVEVLEKQNQTLLKQDDKKIEEINLQNKALKLEQEAILKKEKEDIDSKKLQDGEKKRNETSKVHKEREDIEALVKEEIKSQIKKDIESEEDKMYSEQLKREKSVEVKKNKETDQAEKDKNKLEEETRKNKDKATNKVKLNKDKKKKDGSEKKKLEEEKKIQEEKQILMYEKNKEDQELKNQVESTLNVDIHDTKKINTSLKHDKNEASLIKLEDQRLKADKSSTLIEGSNVPEIYEKEKLEAVKKKDDEIIKEEKSKHEIETHKKGQKYKLNEITKQKKNLDSKMLSLEPSKYNNDNEIETMDSVYIDNSETESYIKEYHYKPKQKDEKDRPTFVDHSHRDYSMDFARPSGYREKSFDKVVETHETLGLGKNATIYKAQTIILDSQLRTSPYPEKDEPRREREEWRSELRKSKALSEARSVVSEKRSVTRDLKRKPVFSTYLTDRTAVEGSRVKLTCSVLSSTDPTITWYRNGIVLDNKLKYITKFIDGLITLEVLNAVPSDSAEYCCTVINENGTVSTSANLKVYPSFEASPIPPTFTRSIRDTYHLAENELVLECRIRGQPLPTITWLKDDKPVSLCERYQAYYLADGVCRLAISRPTPEDSGKYTCKAENSVWSDHISHVVNFTGKESRLSPNLTTLERSRFNRQAMESRRPHFTNVLTDYKVVKGGTIGLQVEIRGSPTHVEWLREGRSVTEIYRNAKTFVEQGLYTLALSDVTEKESGLYTCRAWSNQENVDMNAAITVVPPNDLDGKPATIVGRPEKDILISVGEDVNISFRVQGEPKPKLVFMKGIRDITTSQRVCKMTSDDYVKFTLKRSTISDAGTYCILARNAYGCDRAFVTVVVRQRATSENLISDWTYPMDDTALSMAERKFKSVPDRIPGEPSIVDGGSNWVSIAWPKPDPGSSAPVLAYKVESWLIGKEGGARWSELGITPLNTFDAFNLKQGEEYHFRVTPRNRYGFGESVQTSTPIGVGLAGDRPEFVDILPGQLKVLVNQIANLTCSVKGRPLPEVTWMKNGHEVEEDKRITTSYNGYNCCLTIDNIEIEDEGRYSCEASNVHGRASTYARLAVVTDRTIWEADAKLKKERSANAEGEYPPQFTMRLRDRRVQATYPVRLTCQVVGNPSPTVTWFKDAEEVTFDGRHNKYQDEQFHTLEIAPTTLEDGGVYEATARNSCGAVSCRCGLVVDKGIRAYVAPEFCCGLEPLYRVNEGEELRISAVVEAYPSVGVAWYRNGVRLRPSRRAVMTLDRDGQIELALASITHRDAGVYTCTASNEVGRASTSGKVEVIGGETPVKRPPPVVISPDVPYSKEPMFVRKPRSSEAREGDTVIIACEVVGDPKPDVYWLRDFLKPDYYRDSSHFKRVGDGPEYRFEIPHAKLDYTGAYSVVARNVHGEAKAIISLQIKARDPTCTDEVHNIRYGRVDVIPRFERNLTDLLSYDGDTVEFECRVSGDPEPDIRWFHYNEIIRECPDFETMYQEGAARLKIKQVTADDEGTYTCEASNNLGKATSSACLVVYPPGEPNTLSQRLRRPPALLSAASTPRSTPRSTPARSVSRTPGPESRRVCSPSRSVAPTFYTYPFNKVVEEGENVVFQCAVKGLPSPWTTWDKDGVIITPTSRITIREKDDMLRMLEIEHVSIEDVGVYRITVENEFGRAEASARLEVITRSGKFYAGVRACSVSPRKSLPYRLRPSTSRD